MNKPAAVTKEELRNQDSVTQINSNYRMLNKIKDKIPKWSVAVATTTNIESNHKDQQVVIEKEVIKTILTQLRQMGLQHPREVITNPLTKVKTNNHNHHHL